MTEENPNPAEQTGDVQDPAEPKRVDQNVDTTQVSPGLPPQPDQTQNEQTDQDQDQNDQPELPLDEMVTERASETVTERRGVDR